MSRVAKKPIPVPAGVEVKINATSLEIKGKKGELTLALHRSVDVVSDGAQLLVSPRDGAQQAWAMAGTTRSLVNNMMKGVVDGFERKLQLIGVGYKAQAQGRKLSLTLGFSHPIEYSLPDGVTVETPSQTEIIVKGVDKQAVGQVAAEIRAFRPPEPYKGKGVRYADENVLRKEAKKK